MLSIFWAHLGRERDAPPDDLWRHRAVSIQNRITPISPDITQCHHRRPPQRRLSRRRPRPDRLWPLFQAHHYLITSLSPWAACSPCASRPNISASPSDFSILTAGSITARFTSTPLRRSSSPPADSFGERNLRLREAREITAWDSLPVATGKSLFQSFEEKYWYRCAVKLCLGHRGGGSGNFHIQNLHVVLDRKCKLIRLAVSW